MSKTLRNMSLAFSLIVLAAPMLATDVLAKDSFMTMCSTKFKAAKAAGTPEGSMKWTDFMKSQCAADATAAAPAATPAKASAKATAPAATTVATPSGSFMQNCSAAWKDLKAKNAVPAGMAWKDFVASKCVVPASATAPTPAPTPAPVTMKKKPAAVDTTMDPTPNEPDATMANQEPLKTVDKNGKPFTPGQMAAHQRARDCGGKWRANKPAFAAQYGTWPKYWSACNAEMKAAGK